MYTKNLNPGRFEFAVFANLTVQFILGRYLHLDNGHPVQGSMIQSQDYINNIKRIALLDWENSLFGTTRNP